MRANHAYAPIAKTNKDTVAADLRAAIDARRTPHRVAFSHYESNPNLRFEPTAENVSV
jgi:hypothetical protein